MASVIDRQHIDYNVVRLDGVQLRMHPMMKSKLEKDTIVKFSGVVFPQFI